MNKTENADSCWNFPMTRISNFNLKGDLVRNIYVWGDIWGGGGICSALYIWGGMGSALYTVKLKFGGDICTVLYTWRGICSVFFSWWDILFRSSDSSFYLLNQIDWPKMTYTEFTFIAFRVWFFFSKFSSSHEIMVEDAAGLYYIRQIAWTLGTVGIGSLWTLICTVSKAFCLFN